VVGVAIFGGMALLGLGGSLWWIVAGWALHPLWDVGLHYVAPGRSFAPESYTIACLSFDLLVTAYIAISYGVGELLKSRRRRVAQPLWPPDQPDDRSGPHAGLRIRSS
jgi:hypothetical protein